MFGEVVKMDYSYWNYFLSLERDLQTIGRYVEFSENNFNVYSVEILKLFLAASSEFEVVLKEIGKKYAYSKIVNAKHSEDITIKTLKNFIDETNALASMKNAEICLKQFGLFFMPVKEIWDKESWWKNYNFAKHNRTMNYQKANLSNLLKSMGSLFIANLFLYEKEFHNENCTFDENISIVLANLQETNLLELKNKSYYSFRHAAFFS